MKSMPLSVVHVGLRSEAGIVTANDDAQRSAAATRISFDHSQRRLALEGHDREADHIGLVLAHQSLDGFAHALLHQNQVGDCDVVMRIDVSRQRA